MTHIIPGDDRGRGPRPADRQRRVSTVAGGGPPHTGAATSEPAAEPTAELAAEAASAGGPGPSDGPGRHVAGMARMRLPVHPPMPVPARVSGLRVSGRAARLVGSALLVLLPVAACEETAEGRAPEPRSEIADRLDRSADPAVRDARAALAEGRPFRATQLLSAALEDPARRTPEVELLAASAAAGWEGWSTVRRLLERAPWLDTRFDGDGRELLARAALAGGKDEAAAAAEHARKAADQATTDAVRGVRLALLGRALDRLDRLDEAAAAYTDAARLLPRSADWLRLRAAAVTRDSVARARLLADVRMALPRERLPLVEAEALLRSGDTARAAVAYVAAGDPVTALRYRVAMARDSAARAGLRREVAALVEARPGSAVARAAAELLAGSFAPLGASEALAVARALAPAGSATTAADAFATAARAGSLTADDRLLYARVLFRLGRYEAAAAQFALVPATHRAGGDAAYERARAVLRAGRLAESRTLLRAIPRDFPGDADAAGRALYLLADLATDEGRDEAARAAFRHLAATYPTSGMAPRARFQAAIIAYSDGQYRAAAAELDTLEQRYPRASDALAALYWAGRARARLGDEAAAAARWRRVNEREPLSYYAVLARRRLGLPTWKPAPDAQPRPAFGTVDSAFARADELDRLGLAPELAREHAWLAATADSSPARLLATAEAFQARGSSSRGIALAQRALAAGAPPDVRTYRALYPVVHGDVLAAESGERGLDPALVAALIRQESNFVASARSPAGARGLMQLMPDVGRSVARGLAFPVWDVALLYQPDVNVRLGTTHLATLVRQYDDLPHVLAAYNAGGSRVRRWLEKGGATSDPELFTERIPYVETRDYVRIVERNREVYRALYGW